MSKNFAAQDGTGTAITGGIVNFDSSIVVAVDGSLTPIATDFTASDPTANTAGASTSAYSTPYLLRWVVKGLQAIFSKLQFDASGNLKDSAIARPYTFVDKSSTTSATVSAWSVVSVANTNRQQITIENTSTTATLIVGFGATTSEVAIAGGTIPPGSASGNNIFQVATTQQINVKSVTASVSFVATEGVYS